MSPSTLPSFAPSDNPTLHCYNFPLGWYDSDDSDTRNFDCTWYGQKDNCILYGDDYENMGKTANEACCVCGGGVTNGSPSTVPSLSPDIAATFVSASIQE